LLDEITVSTGLLELNRYPLFSYSILTENPMYKPVSEVFDAQLIPQQPLYPAGFAIEITLDLLLENPMRPIAIAAFLALMPIASGAADWKPVKGTYAVTAKNYLDPSEEEPKDSHVRFQLSGDTAKDIYLAMKVAEKPDECTGATAKQIGEMQCLY
jgi:hypothetical protein